MGDGSMRLLKNIVEDDFRAPVESNSETDGIARPLVWNSCALRVTQIA
jgi:hypothetical protein